MSESDAWALETATSYYPDVFLESFDDEWIVAERGSLANLFLTVLDNLVQYHGLQRNAARVTTYAAGAVEIERPRRLRPFVSQAPQMAAHAGGALRRGGT